jgi:hypothetical protein
MKFRMTANVARQCVRAIGCLKKKVCCSHNKQAASLTRVEFLC